MTYEEAEDIIFKYEMFNRYSCSCHCGNPPCSKCTDQPSRDDYEEALLVYEKI